MPMEKQPKQKVRQKIFLQSLPKSFYSRSYWLTIGRLETSEIPSFNAIRRETPVVNYQLGSLGVRNNMVPTSSSYILCLVMSKTYLLLNTFV